MKTYSTTELRAHLSEVLNTVRYQKKVIAIGHHKKADVLLVPVPDDYEVNVTEINAASPSFEFLADEPDLYTVDDLKKVYV